ncbi:MAG: hypothetical protein A3G34_00365 [Candidatus Lindowbacteria bacterium RIFCSPLOWO2_12_FULL_62_27]|nr:MAG: hypothetical protein A3G34_00365 [Candidatus Lindowbacteria bacterium RIFCSPLOWO2_12_FULL_62_27]OGH63402.1 MAG: hypothetical protein A3I06_08445 [Candidatus Lindowbacteria bacterium RIFCSPLOWO2_02_FULL_62_12]
MILILVTVLLWTGQVVISLTMLDEQTIENRLDVAIAVTPVVKQPWKTEWFIPGIYKCVGFSFTPESDIPIPAHQKITFLSHNRMRINGVIVRQDDGKRFRVQMEGTDIWITRDSIRTGAEIRQEDIDSLERSPHSFAGRRMLWSFLLTGVFGITGVIILLYVDRKGRLAAAPSSEQAEAIAVISGRRLKIARLSFAVTWALAAAFATSMIGTTIGPWFVRRYFEPAIHEVILEDMYDWPLINIILLILPAIIYSYFYKFVFNCYSDKDGWNRMIRDLMTDSPYSKPIICGGFFAGLVMPTVYALVRYFVFHG